MGHKIFDAKLKAAQREGKEVADRIHHHKVALRKALRGESNHEIEPLQKTIRVLNIRLDLACETAEALEEIRPRMDEEERNARERLKDILPKVESLSSTLPRQYSTVTKKLKTIVAQADQLMAEYQTLVDGHYEAQYSSELIGDPAKIPSLFQPDPEPLATLGQKLLMLARIPGSPNPQIKWGPRFAELQKEEQREARRQRREAEYMAKFRTDATTLKTFQ